MSGDMEKDFINRLRDLRNRVNTLSSTLSGDLLPFLHEKDKITFRRLPDSESKDNDVNITTTCSCLMALSQTNKLSEFYLKKIQENEKSENKVGKRTSEREENERGREKGEKSFRKVFDYEDWRSSGLLKMNAFTTTIVVRTYGFLIDYGILEDENKNKLIHKGHKEEWDKISKQKKDSEKSEWNYINIIDDLCKKIPDNFEIKNYPPTSTIAYWFVDGLERAKTNIAEQIWKDLSNWISNKLYQQISYVESNNDLLMDPVDLAMAACLCAKLRRLAENGIIGLKSDNLKNLPTKPELCHGIDLVFSKQAKSGIWPKYFPLFHYPDAGSNFCFTFEMLEAVLNEFGGDNTPIFEIDGALKGLEKAVKWCEHNRFKYNYNKKDYYGWNSGGQIESLLQRKPESWATAVVHMFLWELDQVLTQKIENKLLDKYNAIEPSKEDIWENFIDIDIELGNNKNTVKKIFEEEFIDKYKDIQNSENRTKKLEGSISALLFGPPGTSKTQLAKGLAQKLKWKYINIDPSNFLDKGLEQIYIRSNEIFEDLKDLSFVVILFDEMDALVQTREHGASIDITSQFLTTSMLPKLADLHDNKKLIFLMATNHQERFDSAIKRPGRFDLHICMGPPSAEMKIEKLDSFRVLVSENMKKKLGELIQNGENKKKFDLFTYGEFKSFLESINRIDSSNLTTDEICKQIKSKVKDFENTLLLRDDDLGKYKKCKNKDNEGDEEFIKNFVDHDILDGLNDVKLKKSNYLRYLADKKESKIQRS
ncbi:MAG: AAA family ATPase [Candidatus Omnitrophota bacterium]|jgi:hypothetical protein|nr:MAG: AAA family ATPase [Candidatus Omnitrophota bacterium]